MAWGNEANSTENQDMISGEVNHRILRVDDVNVNDNASIAAEFINSSINDDARALMAEGFLNSTPAAIPQRYNVVHQIVSP